MEGPGRPSAATSAQHLSLRDRVAARSAGLAYAHVTSQPSTNSDNSAGKL